MQKAIDKDPKMLYASEIFHHQSVLHIAATGPIFGGSDAVTGVVRWLLEKGVPWGAEDREGRFAEDVAKLYGNQEARKLLREWAIQKGKRRFSHQEWNAKLNYSIIWNTSCIIKRARARTTRMRVNRSDCYAWISSGRTNFTACRTFFTPTQTTRQRTRSHWFVTRVVMGS